MATVITRSEVMLVRAFGGQYGPLLTSLLVLCIAAPALRGGPVKGALLDLVMSCIVLASIYATAPGRRSVVVGLTLAVVALASHRMFVRHHYEALHVLNYVFLLSILAYASLTILSAVVRDPVVTVETIKGAVGVYLLIGLTWVYVFVLIDILFPGSFRIDPSPDEIAEGHIMVRRQLPRLLYFSFSTLTTLGYGDIVPLRGPAQTACYLEAVVGQIYLTVLVARLVGMHISQPPPATGK
jgi:hypothetical protein